jgi:hypothetical protein
MVYIVVGVFVAFVLVAVVFGRRKGGVGNHSSEGTWDAGGDSGGGSHGHHGCSGGGSCSGGSSCGGGGCGGGGGGD